MRKKSVLEEKMAVRIKFKRQIRPIIVYAPRDSKVSYEGNLMTIKYLGGVIFWSNFDEIEWVSTNEIDVK